MAETLDVTLDQITTDERGHTYQGRQVLSSTPLDADWAPGLLSKMWRIEVEGD